MASESENLDGAAANLQESAKEALEKTETSGSKASEFIQNIAHIVTDKSNQAADSSKTYIANVVHNVENYAQQAASGAGEGGSNMKDTLSKAIHVGAYPGSTTGTPGEGEAASGTDGGLFTSIATWCSSICGSKNADGTPRNIDLRAAADQVSAVLHSSAESVQSHVQSVQSEAPPAYSVAAAESPIDEPAATPKTEE
jgi:ElaB/YqjD/DUF883 family membrane-anchored ribosome-binding protein